MKMEWIQDDPGMAWAAPYQNQIPTTNISNPGSVVHTPRIPNPHHNQYAFDQNINGMVGMSYSPIQPQVSQVPQIQQIPQVPQISQVNLQGQIPEQRQQMQMTRPLAMQQGMQQGVPNMTQMGIPQMVPIQPYSIPYTTVPSRRNKQKPPKFRPCDACRRRKTKCAILPGSTVCVQCQLKNVECTFIDHPTRKSSTVKKRKIDDINNNNNNNNSDTQQHLEVKKSKNSNSPAIFQNNDITNHNKQRNNNVPSRSSFVVGPTSLLDTFLLRQIPLNNDQTNLSDTMSLRSVSKDVFFTLRDDPPSIFSTSSDNNDPYYEELQSLIGPHGPELIRLYFTMVHPYFPILNEKNFMSKYNSSSGTGNINFSSCLLACIYLLGLKWWDYASPACKLADQAKTLSVHQRKHSYAHRFNKRNEEKEKESESENENENENENETENEQEDHEDYDEFNPSKITSILQNIALKSFQNTIKSPKLSSLQSGLLLLQAIPSQTHSWLNISIIISMFEELGLGLDCSNWRLPKWEKSVRKRIAWGIWITEKWICLREGRGTKLRERDWCVKDLTFDDFEDYPSSNSASNLSSSSSTNLNKNNNDIKNGDEIEAHVDIKEATMLFLQLISLTKILSEILDNFYSIVSISKLESSNPSKKNNDNLILQKILQKAKPLQLKLREWFHNLPLNLQLNPSSSSQPNNSINSNEKGKLSSKASLHLSYLAVELTLHRKIITTIYSSKNVQNNNKNENMIPKELINVCRQAANTRLMASLDFLSSLKHEYIASFWFSSTSCNLALIGTFAALLYVTSLTNQEKMYYRDAIGGLRWSLRVREKSWDEAKNAETLLRIAIGKVPEVPQEELFENNNNVNELNEESDKNHLINYDEKDEELIGLEEYYTPSSNNQIINGNTNDVKNDFELLSRRSSIILQEHDNSNSSSVSTPIDIEQHKLVTRTSNNNKNNKNNSPSFSPMNHAQATTFPTPASIGISSPNIPATTNSNTKVSNPAATSSSPNNHRSPITTTTDNSNSNGVMAPLQIPTPGLTVVSNALTPLDGDEFSLNVSRQDDDNKSKMEIENNNNNDNDNKDNNKNQNNTNNKKEIDSMDSMEQFELGNINNDGDQ